MNSRTEVSSVNAGGAVAAVARLQALLRARRSAALRLLGAGGAHCETVAGKDGHSLLASAWFDHASAGVLRCVRYAALVLSSANPKPNPNPNPNPNQVRYATLVLSSDVCAAHARAAAVRWLMMPLALTPTLTPALTPTLTPTLTVPLT